MPRPRPLRGSGWCSRCAEERSRGGEGTSVLFQTRTLSKGRNSRPPTGRRPGGGGGLDDRRKDFRGQRVGGQFGDETPSQHSGTVMLIPFASASERLWTPTPSEQPRGRGFDDMQSVNSDGKPRAEGNLKLASSHTSRGRGDPSPSRLPISGPRELVDAGCRWHWRRGGLYRVYDRPTPASGHVPSARGSPGDQRSERDGERARTIHHATLDLRCAAPPTPNLQLQASPVPSTSSRLAVVSN